MNDDITKRAEFQIGGYSSMAAAAADAKEFANTAVFTNRSALFPNPVTHKVKVAVVSSVPKAWPKPPSMMNTFFIKLTVTVTGAQRAVYGWIERVEHAAQQLSPTAYSATTERSRHLAETGRAGPASAPAPKPGRAAMTPHEEHVQERGLPPPTKQGAAPALAAPVGTPPPKAVDTPAFAKPTAHLES